MHETDPARRNNTIAVVGASRNCRKFGNKCVRAYQHAGWTVYPVNPGGGEIEGLPVHETLAHVPGELHRIAVYLPPPVALREMQKIADRGAREVIFNPGADTPEVLERALELGVPARRACAIVDIGLSPSQFPG